MNSIQNTISSYLNNPTIMEFVINEAISKVAADLGIKSSQVGEEHADQVNAYIAAGLAGCYLASTN